LAALAENPFRSTPVRTTETVAITTVDSFARELALERIDILKIDTQGYDLNVLF
jgi:FkbM family methyltransferase